MSVINQMLKDLDERKPAAAGMPYEPIMKQQPQGNKLPWIIVAVLSVIILAWLLRDLLPVTANDGQPLAAGNETYQKVVPADQTEIKPSQTPPVDDSVAAGKTVAEPIDKLVQADNSVSQQPVTEPVATQTQQPVVTDVVTEAVIPLADDTTSDTNQSALVTEQDTPETQALPTEPRVVKVSPQQSLRDRAEALVTKYKDSGYGVLTDAQYAEVLALDPEFHTLRIDWLSKLNHQNDNRFEGEALAAIQRWPQVYQYRQMLARSWVMAEPQKAYQLLMQQPPTIEQAPDYHGLIAYSAKQMGDLRLASKQYQLLLKSYPERADWWLALALAEDQLQRSASALRAYQQSLRFPGLAKNIQAYAEQRIRALQGF